MEETDEMKRGKTILLRSAWQTVNIGDIAHTPGVLRVLEQHLPEASVILWPGSLDRGVEAMLRRRFPQLRLIRDGDWKVAQPRPDDPTIADAIREADLFLHGSGPSLVGQKEIERWREATDKPYGVYGVTLGGKASSPDTRPDFPPSLRAALDNAAFVYTRETTSLKLAKEIGVRCPRLEFVPDGTFALDLRADVAAKSFMQNVGLEKDRFLCAVPRLRTTPYWEIHPERQFPPDEVAMKTALNAKYAEPDHAKLREAIIAWVRETGLKVLVCPEMTYQVGIIKPLVYDPLPGDVKPKVVPMDRYWLTDEAASVYRDARAVISFECHSPIMANAAGRPGIYVRQPTDTWKGQMYPDLGLGDWKFEADDVSGRELAARLLDIHNRYDAALETARKASRAAAARFAETMDHIRRVIDTAPKRG
jgi:hypothetical protein